MAFISLRNSLTLNLAYLGCVAVRSPGGLLHPEAHGGDRALRDLDRVDHLLRRLVHHVEAAHGAESKPRPTRFTESIGPFSCLSCFQTWKKNSVSFAVLFNVSERRTMIGTALCAVRKVYFSAQLNNLKLILNFQKYYPIEHIFVPACSSVRKIHFFKFK